MNRVLCLTFLLGIGSFVASNANAIQVKQTEVHVSLGRDCKKAYRRRTPGGPFQEHILTLSSAYRARCAIGVRARTAEGPSYNEQFAIIYDLGTLGNGARIGSVSMTDIYGKGELSLIYNPYVCGAVVIYSPDLFAALSGAHSLDDILAKTTVMERFRFAVTPGSFKYSQCPGNYR